MTITRTIQPATAYKLEITASGTTGSCNQQLWLYENATHKWANYNHGGTSGWRVVSFKNLYFTGESSGVYGFSVVGVVKEGTTYKEVLFTGSTCALIGNCETTSATPGVGQVQPNGATLQPETACDDVLKFEQSLKKLLNGLKADVDSNKNLNELPEYANDGFLPGFLGDNTTAVTGVWSNPSDDRFVITIGGQTPFILTSPVMKSIMNVHNFVEIVDVDVLDISSNVYDTLKITYRTTSTSPSSSIFSFDAKIEYGLPYDCCVADAHRMVPMIVLKKEELDTRGNKIKTTEVSFYPSVAGINVGQPIEVDFHGKVNSIFSTSANLFQGTQLTIGGTTYSLGSGLVMESKTYETASSLTSLTNNAGKVGTTTTSEHPFDFEMYQMNWGVNSTNRVYGFEEGSGTSVASAPTGTNVTLSTSTSWVSTPEKGVYFNKANNVTGSFSNPDDFVFDNNENLKFGFKITPKSALPTSGFNDFRGFVAQVQDKEEAAGSTLVRYSVQAYMTNEKLECKECIPKPPAAVACDEKYTYWKDTLMKFQNNANGKLESVNVPGYLLNEFYERDNFCNLHFGYLVDAYKYYLQQLGIINIDSGGTISANANSGHDHFISLSKFGDTPLNYGFEGINDVVDAFKAYTAIASANTNLEDDYSWNEYVKEVYVKQVKVCPPMAMIPTNLEPVYPEEDCQGEIDFITAAYASAAYQEHINGILADFKRDYINKALSTVVETFDVSYKDKEYQYTLYYYDQAGNLKQTVPPEGVHRFDVSTNNASSPNDDINAHRLRDQYNDTNENNDENTDLLPRHRLQTKYKYNSINQLVWQHTPDGKDIRFAYDKLGRIIATQNANQKEAKDGKIRFSYMLYDPLGRTAEVGEIIVPAAATPTVASYVISDIGRLEKVVSGQANVKVDGFEGSHAKREVTRTHYDKVVELGNSTNSGSYFYPVLNSDESFNYRNRVAAVLYYNELVAGSTAVAGYDFGIFYRYDIHSNVKELVHHQPGMYINNTEHHLKRIHYDYDLVSGNVHKVYYQKDKEDQFIHKYSYDIDNRIVDVHTSSDGIIWEREANYEYYDHGALARVLIGDKRVQAMDYAYTLNGWLKAVNSESAQAADDMGHDGDVNNVATRNIGQDAFGYSLSYYENDYKARFPGALKTVGANNTITRDVYRHTNIHAGTTLGGLSGDLNLYNGNIKQIVTAVRDLSSTSGNKVYGALTRYQYDQLNRIKTLRGSLVDHNGTAHETIKANRVRANYTFDRNGNLTTLARWMPDASTTNLYAKRIDSLTYKYQHETVTLGHGQTTKTVKKRNQLLAVYDAVGVQMNEDLMDQMAPMQTTNTGFNEQSGQHDNYKYDEIGQLTHDYTEKLQISWRVDGKVAKVERFRAFVYKTLPEKHILKDYLSVIEFQYDGLGNRVAKKVTSYASDGSTPTSIKTHYYVRDAQGNVMAIYQYNGNPNNQGTINDHLPLPNDGDDDVVMGTSNAIQLAYKTITVCSENNSLLYHVENGASQTLQAGEVITLKPGFHAKDGSSFHAKIEAVASNNLSQQLVEHHIYAKGRLGLENKTQTLSTTAPIVNTETFVLLNKAVGDKKYEFGNHLDNVLSVVSDKKLPDFTTTSLTFKPEIFSYNEFMPFGMPVYNRSQTGGYRYGFNGKEKDDEIKGKGNSYDFGARMLDTRIGRWFSLDPYYKQVQGNYNFAINSPIMIEDKDGQDDYYYDTATGAWHIVYNGEPNNYYTIHYKYSKSENGLEVGSFDGFVKHSINDDIMRKLKIEGKPVFEYALGKASNHEHKKLIYSSYKSFDEKYIIGITMAPLLIVAALEVGPAALLNQAGKNALLNLGMETGTSLYLKGDLSNVDVIDVALSPLPAKYNLIFSAAMDYNTSSGLKVFGAKYVGLEDYHKSGFATSVDLVFGYGMNKVSSQLTKINFKIDQLADKMELKALHSKVLDDSLGELNLWVLTETNIKGVRGTMFIWRNNFQKMKSLRDEAGAYGRKISGLEDYRDVYQFILKYVQAPGHTGKEALKSLENQ